MRELLVKGVAKMRARSKTISSASTCPLPQPVAKPFKPGGGAPAASRLQEELGAQDIVDDSSDEEMDGAGDCLICRGEEADQLFKTWYKAKVR